MWQMLNGNPQAISRMMQNNPNVQSVKKLIEENGGDAEKAFRSKANEMGIDADEFINALKQITSAHSDLYTGYPTRG